MIYFTFGGLITKGILTRKWSKYPIFFINQEKVLLIPFWILALTTLPYALKFTVFVEMVVALFLTSLGLREKVQEPQDWMEIFPTLLAKGSLFQKKYGWGDPYGLKEQLVLEG